MHVCGLCVVVSVVRACALFIDVIVSVVWIDFICVGLVWCWYGCCGLLCVELRCLAGGVIVCVWCGAIVDVCCYSVKLCQVVCCRVVQFALFVLLRVIGVRIVCGIV